MVKKIIPLIICGGSGSRLWPISDKKKPKQFINFFDDKTLFDLTLERSKTLTDEIPIIIASKEHKDHIEKSLKKYKLKGNLILEEVGRNTTAAIMFGLISANERGSENNVVIMPSDHYISDNIAFKKNILNIILSKKNFVWSLLGIKPNYPATGYGYINAEGRQDIKRIESFIEKPDQKTANGLILLDNIFWNSGIFIGNTIELLSSIKKHASDIYYCCKKTWQNKIIINSCETILRSSYLNKTRSESIDKSVLEKEQSKSVSLLNTAWSDIGSWDTISNLDFLKKNHNEKLIQLDSTNNYISSDDKEIILIGVKDLIIVTKENKILILKKGDSEKIKEVYKNN